MRAQQMSAVNRTTTPTNIELAFQDGCTGSPNDDAATLTMNLNTMLETNRNDLIMEESNRARVNASQRLDQCNNVACRDPARREEEQEADTPQWRIAREQPERRDEENEQRCTRREQPGVLEHEAIQRATARDEPGRRKKEPRNQYYWDDFIPAQRRMHVVLLLTVVMLDW